MPIYIYQATSTNGCDHCRDGFEILQRLSDTPLQYCPQCLGPVRKVPAKPNLATGGPALTDRNVEKHGFTRYRKVKKGMYEKTAGKGPGIISDDD